MPAARKGSRILESRIGELTFFVGSDQGLIGLLTTAAQGRAVEATKPDPVQGSSASARLRVVSLVDDDASVRKSVTRLLESDGFSVLAFSEPKQFLEHLRTHEVEVAVLDIWMDQMTGIELLGHLSAKSRKTRVIFITGQENLAARATILQGGAFAFFMKPFDDTAFLAAIRRAFGRGS